MSQYEDFPELAREMGWRGLAAMNESMIAEYMPQDELDEMERLARPDPSFYFIDADDPECVADETAEFEHRFDNVSFSPAKTRKAWTHNSMVLSERVKRVCRDVIDRCRKALRDHQHVDVNAMCDALSRLEREVLAMDRRLAEMGLPKCYDFCSEKLERAHDILDAVMSRDERWQMEEARRNIPVVFRARKAYKPALFKTCTMVKNGQRQIVATAARAEFLVHQGWATAA